MQLVGEIGVRRIGEGIADRDPCLVLYWIDIADGALRGVILPGLPGDAVAERRLFAGVLGLPVGVVFLGIGNGLGEGRGEQAWTGAMSLPRRAMQKTWPICWGEMVIICAAAGRVVRASARPAKAMMRCMFAPVFRAGAPIKPCG